MIDLQRCLIHRFIQSYPRDQNGYFYGIVYREKLPLTCHLSEFKLFSQSCMTLKEHFSHAFKIKEEAFKTGKKIVAIEISISCVSTNLFIPTENT